MAHGMELGLPSYRGCSGVRTNIAGITRDFAGNPINGKPEAGILEYGVITVPPPVTPTTRTFIIRSSYGQLIVKPGN